jgi:hypothetical protein
MEQRNQDNEFWGGVKKAVVLGSVLYSAAWVVDGIFNLFIEAGVERDKRKMEYLKAQRELAAREAVEGKNITAEIPIEWVVSVSTRELPRPRGWKPPFPRRALKTRWNEAPRGRIYQARPKDVIDNWFEILFNENGTVAMDQHTDEERQTLLSNASVVKSAREAVVQYMHDHLSDDLALEYPYVIITPNVAEKAKAKCQQRPSKPTEALAVRR